MGAIPRGAVRSGVVIAEWLVCVTRFYAPGAGDGDDFARRRVERESVIWKTEIESAGKKVSVTTAVPRIPNRTMAPTPR